VDPELKDANQKRLRRIEGQIRGLQKMVDEDRYLRRHHHPGGFRAGGFARRGAQPDEESSASLRCKSAAKREKRRNRSHVRRIARIDLRTSAVAPSSLEETTQ